MTAPKKKDKKQNLDSVFEQKTLNSSNKISTLFQSFFNDFFSWWYVQMPVKHILSLRRIVTVINDQFSISLLLKSFFTPWHRDGSFVGYLIGISMRVLYLPIAISVLLFFIGGYLVFLFVWTLLPPVAVVMSIISPFLK